MPPLFFHCDYQKLYYLVSYCLCLLPTCKVSEERNLFLLYFNKYVTLSVKVIIHNISIIKECFSQKSCFIQLKAESSLDSESYCLCSLPHPTLTPSLLGPSGLPLAIFMNECFYSSQQYQHVDNCVSQTLKQLFVSQRLCGGSSTSTPVESANGILGQMAVL